MPQAYSLPQLVEDSIHLLIIYLLYSFICLFIYFTIFKKICIEMKMQNVHEI